MPFSIVCVAPGASEAQVVDLASSMGEGWWEFDTLPTTVSEWWRKELLELKPWVLAYVDDADSPTTESEDVEGSDFEGNEAGEEEAEQEEAEEEAETE